MRRLAVLLGLLGGAVFAWFVLAAPSPVEAKAICQCTCFDSSETATLIRTASTKTTEFCKTTVCPPAVEGIGATLVEDETIYNANTDRCLCAYQKIVKTLKYAPLSTGQQTCLSDCSKTCGGLGNVIQDETTPKIVDASCVPGQSADCKAGAFSKYEGITCALQATLEQGWPQNKKPACIVPLTPKNANLECKNYGGIAKGGTCGAIASGENPNTLLKSRPFLKPDGSYGVNDYTQPYSYQEWKAAMVAELAQKTGKQSPNIKLDIPDGAGICYQLGAIYGGLPTYESYVPESTVGAVPENDYVCLKKKSNTCGSVTPPDAIVDPQAPTKTSQFSCQRPVDYLANVKFPTVFKNGTYNEGSDAYVEATCFPTAGYEDACATLPNYRCCPQKKTGGCFLDRDCSLDNSKTCQGANILALKLGTCVWNTVCDKEHNAEVDEQSQDFKEHPWTFDRRRCRTASPVEMADSSICSAEFSPALHAPRRCPKPGESCCQSANPQALSTCAADKAVGGGGNTVWNKFACIEVNGIPSTEYVTDQSGYKQLKTFKEDDFLANVDDSSSSYYGGNCLTDDTPKQDGGTQARCASGKYCCYTPAIKDEGGKDYEATVLANRAGEHEKCPKNTPEQDFYCIKRNSLGGSTDDDAQELGFATIEAYFSSLASSNYCKVTPLESYGTIFSNAECVFDHLCCSFKFLDGTKICDPANDQCNVNSSCNPDTNPKTCKKCDPELKVCVDAGLYEQNLASDSCFTRAQALGEESAKEVANVTKTDPKAFTCQAIFPETPDWTSKCTLKGCEELEEAGGVPPGTNIRCCIPGVGQTAAAAAKAAEEAKKIAPEQIPVAPFSLRLPPCITSGNCQLSDIIFAGAQFANFLIGISGSVFLAIFIYGGFMYLTAGSSDRAAKGKKMIVQSTFAMALILGAYIFISFIQSSLISSAAGQKGKLTCGATPETKNFQCGLLKSPADDQKALNAEIEERGCKKGLCPGPSNYVCCPT